MEQIGANSMSQEISTLPLKESPEAAWRVCFKITDWFQPLKFLLQWLHKGCSLLRCLFLVKPRDGNKRQPATKRLGTVAQILFAIIPIRLQLALGFLHNMCQSIEIEKTLKSPVTPSMRGSKRKKEEDAVVDEPQCWIETILKDFPDNDDSEDLTYEPTKSESDSEEYKSQNDTEGDLEYEEKDGLVILKEDPISPVFLQGQNGEDTAAETPETEDVREELVASRTSGDDNKYPEHCLLTNSGICSLKSLESTEIIAASIQSSDTVDSNDSEEAFKKRMSMEILSHQVQNGEDTAAETPETADVREELVASRTSGDDDKYPEHCLLTNSGICSLRSLESTEIIAASIQSSDRVDSNDSEEVWTEAGCPE